MTARKIQPEPIRPDLSPEKGYAILLKQLESLQILKTLDYIEGKPRESEWYQFTGKIILRTFGSDSPNKTNFSRAVSAGSHFIRPYGYGEDHDNNQSNSLARIQSYENVLNSSLQELKIDLPEPEIQGVFEQGQEYEFYRAVKKILGLAMAEVFIVDPYLSVEIFDEYADAIPRSKVFRLLSANVHASVLSVALKYASGGNFQFRSSNEIHDRVLFADSRVWVCGQSLKDAAKKKPTDIVEHDGPLMKNAYEERWARAIQIV